MGEKSDDCREGSGVHIPVPKQVREEMEEAERGEEEKMEDGGEKDGGRRGGQGGKRAKWRKEESPIKDTGGRRQKG